MSVTRVGATKQYSDNWENIFGGGRSGRSAGKRKANRPSSKSAKKKSTPSNARKPVKVKKASRRK